MFPALNETTHVRVRPGSLRNSQTHCSGAFRQLLAAGYTLAKIHDNISLLTGTERVLPVQGLPATGPRHPLWFLNPLKGTHCGMEGNTNDAEDGSESGLLDQTIRALEQDRHRRIHRILVRAARVRHSVAHPPNSHRRGCNLRRVALAGRQQREHSRYLVQSHPRRQCMNPTSRTLALDIAHEKGAFLDRKWLKRSPVAHPQIAG